VRGGKVLGMGLNGYVHYGKEGSEGIQCKDGSEWKEGEVAKVGRDLSQEFARVKQIQLQYPAISEFAILPTRVCEMDEAAYQTFLSSQPDSGTRMMLELRSEQYQEEGLLSEHPPEILFAPYGGKTLEDVSGPEVVKALETLREHVKDMNAHRVYHQDIGLSNIVYKDGKAYLIDFGTGYIAPEDEPLDGEDVEMMDEVIQTLSRKGGVRRKHFQRNRQ
jgi:hypothetical protein